jgi:beta-lactamase regulating signal transducer with metallopeptidase domain
MELPEAWVLGWWRWLAPLAIQGGLLLLAVAMADLLLPRHTWPQLRRGLWLLALARLVLPPQLASPVALARWLPLPPERLAFLQPTALESTLSATDPQRAESLLKWAGVSVTVWLLGVLLLTLAGIAAAWRQHRRIRQNHGEAPPWLPDLAASMARRVGLRRAPRVVVHTTVPGPCVLGLFRPRVLLPADLTPEEAAPALAHEFAHLRRGDLWVAAAVTLLQVVYWFHPAVWWARHRLGRLTEQCCDRTVLRVLDQDAAGYRRALLHFAARRLGLPRRPETTPGLGLVTPRNALLVRLSLLEAARGERLGRVRLATAGVAATMLACVLPMAPAAEDSAAAVAEMIERPPGCLPLRYLVLQRLAEEDGYLPPPADSLPPDTEIEP